MPQVDPIRAGSSLVLDQTDEWVAASDVTTRLAVIIHGFTADSGYMRRLASLVGKSQFVASRFDYDSYFGIEHAAGLLVAKLDRSASRWGGMDTFSSHTAWEDW